MDGSKRLGALVGEWDLQATVDGRVLATFRATFSWLGDLGLLRQEVRALAYADPAWEAASPMPTDAMIGADDHSGRFTMLYADTRGVHRVYAMTLDDRVWTLAGRPGAEFFQRFEGRFSPDGNRIDARWEASPNGVDWSVDFELTYTRVG